MATQQAKPEPPKDPLAGDWSLRRKLAVVLAPALGWLLLFALCESLQPGCIPEREKAAQEGHKAGNADGAAYAIAVSDKVDPQASKEKAIKSGTQSRCSWPCYMVNKTAEDVVGFFTAILAYVVWIQVMLMFSQEKWLRRTYKTAAYANTLALDTSISTHRPSIRVKHVFLKSDIWAGERIKIELAIVNTGINTARIIGVDVETLILPFTRVLPQIPPVGANTYVPSYPFLEGGKTYVLPNHWETKKLTDEENAGIRNRTSRLYCFGFVDYIDLSGKVLRKTHFIRVLRIPDHPASHQDMGRFVKLEPENTDYEYAD